MPSNYWTLTTAKPEGYFVGSPHQLYTNALSPLSCPEGQFFSFGGGMTSIGWTSVSGETVGSHVLTFRAQETQSATLVPSPEFLTRVYCHAVISALPDESLPELAEDLSDLRAKYLIPTTVSLPLLTTSVKLKARLGKSIARPEIQLDKE